MADHKEYPDMPSSSSSSSSKMFSELLTLPPISKPPDAVSRTIRSQTTSIIQSLPPRPIGWGEGWGEGHKAENTHRSANRPGAPVSILRQLN